MELENIGKKAEQQSRATAVSIDITMLMSVCCSAVDEKGKKLLENYKR